MGSLREDQDVEFAEIFDDEAIRQVGEYVMALYDRETYMCGRPSVEEWADDDVLMKWDGLSDEQREEFREWADDFFVVSHDVGIIAYLSGKSPVEVRAWLGKDLTESD